MVIVRLLEAQGVALSDENVSGSLMPLLQATAQNAAIRDAPDRVALTSDGCALASLAAKAMEHDYFVVSNAEV